ncbi:MAG TPA: class I tRNA ligase family protein, partial [Candidatus Limnocylindria bacterium]|nr:class I tRNA ligase family protein [Candidatus Limnocylindria bacterium]
MAAPDTFYVTTAIFYPSPAPPLHSLYEAFGTDALARYHRLLGDETRFLTGMDEHSAQVERLARDRDTDPRPLIDGWAASWQATFDRFGISYDRFIRTTDDDHVRAS